MAHDFLTDLAAKRQKYLEGLDANEGDINLDIFEDFYPDKAHFVFEILQNAEDVEATEVSFQLSQKGCLIEHDGKRLFNENDIRSITGIHNSTKKNKSDQIGRWGVGFKSVFAYTISPEIQSGVYSFKIVRLVKPEVIDSVDLAENKTRIWLPFNHPKKPSDDAYREVEGGLRDFAETTLLFLNHLQSITWKIVDSQAGALLRILHTESHVEVLKETNGTTTASSHFLRFARPVEGFSKATQHKVAASFALKFLPEIKTFNSNVPLAKQMMIAPVQGQVSVFFPAKKETSGLRFHLHAPFVPELSRASIKETPANEPLFEQLAVLCAASMHDIKELGFLRRDFLRVLPNLQDTLGTPYSQIKDAIINAFNEEPLMPTFGDSHSPAKYLLQAKPSLKDLLPDQDLEFLISHDDVSPKWAVNRELQGTDAERFMSGLAMRVWDVDEFLKMVAEEAYGERSGPDEGFLEWLSGKPAEWLQRMYALLARDRETDEYLYQFKHARIIRLSDGTFSTGGKCYFPDEEGRYTNIVPCVDPEILETGSSKKRKKFARKFLEEIGVGVIGERELVQAILEKEYFSEVRPVKKSEYLNHLKRFMKLIEDDPSGHSIFSGRMLFLGADERWHDACTVYLDRPYGETGLKDYYDAVGLPDGVSALSESYLEWKIEPSGLRRFAETLGAQRLLEIEQTSCSGNPKWDYLNNVDGLRLTDHSIDKDFWIPNLYEIVEKRSHRVSELIWNTLADKCQPPINQYLQAEYRINRKNGSRYEESQLVHSLKTLEWVPQGENFVRPAAARAELLPDGFTHDAGWAWIKAIEFGKESEFETEKAKAAAAEAGERSNRRSAAAAELGFNPDDLDWLEKFKDIPAEQRERLLQEWHKSRQPVELPDHEPRNPDRRAERVGAQAKNAPERKTEERTRSVSVGREEVKAEAAEYLQQQYVNDGNIICQVCHGPMPFRLDDGSAYFEKVEFLSELKRRHHQNYLVLCPNHAAMFQHANSTKDIMKEMFTELTDNELEVVLAQENTTVYFTKTHVADLKKVIEVDGPTSNVSDGDPTESLNTDAQGKT